MEIPEKVKIGDHYYDIKKVTTVDWFNSNVVGKVDYGRKEMKMKMFDKDHRNNEDIFFHEVAHGILKELSFNHPQISKFGSDETFVQEFGLTLRKTFLDLLDNQVKEDQDDKTRR